ncbi:MAG: TetR/AcrR family transcriptional regulator [Planctomycetes bacterium]|nr:TetR/AcrR family transcriptional regulator [Planctomycetota bacterium]MCP4770169.1 TetR/AcrR family transcriptional regulator [Planctomycetota bacterium]MCP4860683.1 TetR/AcrR family transcriptional regulator [Planctomycetota bacterium]
MTANGDLRSRILEQARVLLLKEGYSAVSMRKIAKAVGCTPTSIYIYFDNKDALIHALIEEGMELLAGDLAKASAPDSEPRARFRGTCLAFLEFGIQNPEYYQIMFLLHPEKMERYPTDKYRRARRNLELFADILREVRSGSSFDPMLSATVLWSLLHGAISLHLAQRLDVGMPASTFIDQVVEHAESMLLPESP